MLSAFSPNLSDPSEKISLQITPKGPILEGDNVTLKCIADGNPPPGSYFFHLKVRQRLVFRSLNHSCFLIVFHFSLCHVIIYFFTSGPENASGEIGHLCSEWNQQRGDGRIQMLPDWQRQNGGISKYHRQLWVLMTYAVQSNLTTIGKKKRKIEFESPASRVTIHRHGSEIYS